MAEKLRVGVIGAGRWSASAHLPGFHRSPLSELVVLCDLDRDLAEARAREFGIPEVITDYEKVLSRRDIDVVDIVTRGDRQDLASRRSRRASTCSWRSRSATTTKDVWQAHELAQSEGLKTKVGLTFRYAPAVMYMFDLIREGSSAGPSSSTATSRTRSGSTPTTRWTSASTRRSPWARRPGGRPEPEGITVWSLEGYGAPTIDIGLECVGSDLKQDRGDPRQHGAPSAAHEPRHGAQAHQHRRRRHVHGRGRRTARSSRSSRATSPWATTQASRPHLRVRGRHQGAPGGGVRGDPDHPHREARRGGVRGAGDSGEVLPPGLPGGGRLERGLLRQPRPQLLPRRSSTAAPRTRATSPRAPGCRRSSTRWRCRIGRTGGWTCPWPRRGGAGIGRALSSRPGFIDVVLLRPRLAWLVAVFEFRVPASRPRPREGWQ